ncbi:MAG: hypothetical protein INH05_17550, partial [Burkholderiales bacterium]|nr:hypothetical protein [Burkholderiales bacterium]
MLQAATRHPQVAHHPPRGDRAGLLRVGAAGRRAPVGLALREHLDDDHRRDRAAGVGLRLARRRPGDDDPDGVRVAADRAEDHRRARRGQPAAGCPEAIGQPAPELHAPRLEVRGRGRPVRGLHPRDQIVGRRRGLSAEARNHPWFTLAGTRATVGRIPLDVHGWSALDPTRDERRTHGAGRARRGAADRAGGRAMKRRALYSASPDAKAEPAAEAA